MVSSSEDVTTPTMVLLKYGPGLECPWTDRNLAKQRFQSKILLIPGELSRLLVLMKPTLEEQRILLVILLRDTPHSSSLGIVVGHGDVGWPWWRGANVD